jgi:hypothetical protein
MISRPLRPPMPVRRATPQQPIEARKQMWLRWTLPGAMLIVAVSAPGAPIDELHALVESGRAEEADKVFCADSDLATRPRAFDLWCGIAAVDLGRAGEGVLALERYVLEFPNDLRARLELARAYFHAGDNLRAREEFEGVAKEGPPPEVQAGID